MYIAARHRKRTQVVSRASDSTADTIIIARVATVAVLTVPHFTVCHVNPRPSYIIVNFAGGTILNAITPLHQTMIQLRLYFDFVALNSTVPAKENATCVTRMPIVSHRHIVEVDDTSIEIHQ